MILLDTNALIWIAIGHARARPLIQRRQRLYVSPASLLELQIVQEAGKLRLKNASADWAVDDDRWLVDEPPGTTWFLRAAGVGWTRDPFDRLLVAHAQLRRWRFATGDARIVEQLGAAATLSL